VPKNTFTQFLPSPRFLFFPFFFPYPPLFPFPREGRVERIFSLFFLFPYPPFFVFFFLAGDGEINYFGTFSLFPFLFFRRGRGRCRDGAAAGTIYLSSLSFLPLSFSPPFNEEEKEKTSPAPPLSLFREVNGLQVFLRPFFSLFPLS